jgi:hypothetical protein
LRLKKGKVKNETHKYKLDVGKECPHEALDGKDVCYWYEERTYMHLIEELKTRDFKNLDLVEADLQEADLVRAYF